VKLAIFNKVVKQKANLPKS